MPIEIRELEISVSIENTDNAAPPSTSSSAPKNVDDIVARCVEQVMDLLREQKEA